jgi:hypothetical protein
MAEPAPSGRTHGGRDIDGKRGNASREHALVGDQALDAPARAPFRTGVFAVSAGLSRLADDHVEHVPVLGAQERRPIFLRLVDDDDVEPVHEPFDLRPLVEPHVGPARPGVVRTEQVTTRYPPGLARRTEWR